MKEIKFINPDSVRVDDEFSRVFGPLDEETEAALTTSLLQGFDVSKGKITVWYEPGDENPVIVDGHNRFRICRENGVTLVSSNFAEKKFTNRQAVIAWILETQLSRRNLTDVERVELTEKYRSILTARGKANMSAGGKGSTISTKVDTRKACAQMAGVGEGKYSEICKVLNSDDEDTKQKLRAGEMSAHAAAQKVKEQNTRHEPDGGGKIQKNLRQMMQIDRKVHSLNAQREQLYRETCKIVCEMPDSEMKYLWGAGTDVLCIYLEHSGFQATIYVGYIIDDMPDEDQMSKCPGGRREEFRSIWKKAKAEMDQRRSAHDDSGGYERDSTGRTDDGSQDGSFGADSRSQKAVRSIRTISPEFRKKAGKVIARYFHEDNGHSTEESQWANAIYEFLTAV